MAERNDISGLLAFIGREGDWRERLHPDMPRLSVDIDLTSVPVKDRAESLGEINETLDRIMDVANGGIPRRQAQRIEGGGGGAIPVRARLDGAEVKIETSPVTRGVVHGNTAQFLLSLHDGEPDFKAVGFPKAHTLPAVRWKLLNLKKLAHENVAKHAAQRAELENLCCTS